MARLDSGTAVFESRVPAAYKQIIGTVADYKFWTVPQSHARNQKIYWPRGENIFIAQL